MLLIGCLNQINITAMYRIILTLLTLLFFTYACKEKASVTVTETADTTAVKTDTVVPKGLSLILSWESDTVFRTPESVAYDPSNNLLYVSNIGGVPPNKKDGDGFISQVDLNGKVIKLKWATGFDAPKGLGLMGTTLYVTDIDRLKAIDTKTGKTIKTWKVPGSTFLNDVAVSSDSIIYFTDSDKSTIHKLRKGVLSVFHVDTSLGGTNGISIDSNRLHIAGYQSGNVYMMSLDDQAVEKFATGIPSGDGIEKYRDGWIVTNWNGEIYHVDNMGTVNMLMDTKQRMNSADIEVIEDKNLLLVPTFYANKIVAYKIHTN